MQDVTQRCYNSTHLKFALGLGIPGHIFCTLGVPFAIVWIVFTNKRRLHLPHTIMRFGFIYQVRSRPANTLHPHCRFVPRLNPLAGACPAPSSQSACRVKSS